MKTRPKRSSIARIFDVGFRYELSRKLGLLFLATLFFVSSCVTIIKVRDSKKVEVNTRNDGGDGDQAPIIQVDSLKVLDVR